MAFSTSIYLLLACFWPYSKIFKSFQVSFYVDVADCSCFSYSKLTLLDVLQPQSTALLFVELLVCFPVCECS